ncbi:hypothetical protein [uncultured Marinobacter sp.]|uniref:hypothetical protein n=1 Tax=uncultured Marinobacter sp. TaxID=187379 RepID=UPI0030DBD86D|tara:strand:+ start:131 stop:490 length:360 start_codon:yes stop_codon:yes gene_type:complete
MTITRTENREPRHSRLQVVWLSLAFCVLTVPLTLVHAQDQAGAVVTIDGGRIQGEQELPTVLYLVPWQPVETTGPQPMEEQLLTDGVIEPLERETFLRRLDYHRSFQNAAPGRLGNSTE